MDIRVASYNTGTARPVNITTVSQSGSPFTTAYVNNSSANGPVQAVNQVNALPSSSPTQTANGDGYTDSVRGSIINILA